MAVGAPARRCPGLTLSLGVLVPLVDEYDHFMPGVLGIALVTGKVAA